MLIDSLVASMRGVRIIPYPECEHLGQRGSGLSLNLRGGKDLIKFNRIKEKLIKLDKP